MSCGFVVARDTWYDNETRDVNSFSDLCRCFGRDLSGVAHHANLKWRNGRLNLRWKRSRSSPVVPHAQDLPHVERSA